MPLPPLLLAAACLATAALAWAAAAGVRRLLIRAGVYDAPNERSLHSRPVPRGGGAALLPVIALAWLAGAQFAPAPAGLLPLLGLGLLLGAVSFVDDLRGLSAGPRLLAQLAAVAAGLAVLDPAPVFQGWLPFWLDRALAGLAWLWFVNLFNFMDGIDGISAAESLVIALGLVAVGAVAGWPRAELWPALLLAAAVVGYLPWSWQPAAIFLGDVGSTGLGYLLGGLLLAAAASGEWAAALILPAYYLTDATLTLLRRLLRGVKVWRPHREHAYQRAVQAGWSHARTAGHVAGGGLLLIGCATLAAAGWPVPGLVGAAVVAAALMGLFLKAGNA